MPPDIDDVVVNYTVKELLANLQRELVAGMARLETSMTGKADKADIARLELGLGAQAKEIQRHHDRLLTVEAQVREEKIARETARDTARNTNAWWHGRLAKVGSVLLGICLAAGAIAAVVALVQSFTS